MKTSTRRYLVNLGMAAVLLAAAYALGGCATAGNAPPPMADGLPTVVSTEPGWMPSVLCGLGIAIGAAVSGVSGAVGGGTGLCQ
jgi:hypothetical protein